MDLLKYYQSAKLSGLEPTLLEFKHPRKNTMLGICGIAPIMTLEVKKGRLFKDGVDAGEALEIFEYLNAFKKNLSPTFFPAILGFFSYEFATYFDLPVHPGPRHFPDAFFRLYEKGLFIDDGEIIHYDPLPYHELQFHKKFELQSLTPSLSQESFLHAVECIKNTIKEGEVYQVNLSLPFYFGEPEAPLALYQAMRKLNPSPFMGLLEHEEWTLISGSPERLFSFKDGDLRARPIAGTKRRGTEQNADDRIMAELLACPKENAEHAMLVDLMRNDINQVCLAGSVNIDEDRSVEFYSHVMHLVSQISGKCERPLKEVLRALFPGGTITGAPKKNVMASIAKLELEPRGPYTGSFGYISGGFGTDLNILIRSVLKAKERMWINSGAGIVIDSNPESEWQEVHKKAGFIKDILAQNVEPKAPRESHIGHALCQLAIDTSALQKRVLFVENQDSFSYNIIAAFKNLGAHVAIADAGEYFDLTDFGHVVIGPGPGNPEHLPKLQKLIKRVIEHGTPLLGICLGHQAIGHYFGAPIIKRPPIHGLSLPINHCQERLFSGLKTPTLFTRYHSLAVSHAPSGFLLDAVSQDDCIMAISHGTKPIFGVQFHPESYLSESGHLILGNFLRTR